MTLQCCPGPRRDFAYRAEQEAFDACYGSDAEQAAAYYGATELELADDLDAEVA